MRKILVTGATGFIGKHVLSDLDKMDYQVIAISRSGNAYDGVNVDLLKNFHVMQSIIEDAKPEYLLHLAWNIERGYLNSNENYDWFESSFRLLRSFVENGGQRVVFAGTCFEYDLRYGLCSEKLTPLKPTSVYGVCKNSLYTLMKSYCEQNGMSWAWGRIFYPFGPGERADRFFPYIIKQALENKLIEVKTSKQVRDFVYVKDLARMLTVLLFSNFIGAVNLASGIGYSRKNIVEKILRLMNSKSVVQYQNIHSTEPRFLLGDISRLSSFYGEENTEIHEALQETIDYWKEEAGL